MPKDTKSSGYNKAPACESRGFGHKKEGENFDTPSTIKMGIRRNPFAFTEHGVIMLASVLRSEIAELQSKKAFNDKLRPRIGFVK